MLAGMHVIEERDGDSEMCRGGEGVAGGDPTVCARGAGGAVSGGLRCNTRGYTVRRQNELDRTQLLQLSLPSFKRG